MTKRKRILIAVMVTITSPIWIALGLLVGPLWLLGKAVYDVLGQEIVSTGRAPEEGK